VTYHLSPGKYFLADIAIDARTGHIHATEGSIKFVTVK
jgi:hypothetical protein